MVAEAMPELQHTGGISPLCPAAHEDLLDWFKYLRENCPVYKDDEGRYILTKYDDVYAALRDPDTFSSAHELTKSIVPEANQRWVVYSDDPDHLEIRKLVNRGLTPAAISEMNDRFRAYAKAAVDALEPGIPFDVVQTGKQFAFHCWCSISGLPDDQHDRMIFWTKASGNMTGPADKRPPLPRRFDYPGHKPGESPEFMGAYRDMEAYFKKQVATHRDHDPKFCKDEEQVPPLVRAIVASVKAKPEALDVILQRIYPVMIAGGTSTVAHIFANSVDVLLKHPGVWERLQNDPSLLDPDQASEVIEEILRLESVHPGLNKTTTRDVEVRGEVIPAGSFVQLYYISADHDEEAWEDAEEFKDRGVSRHLAFGFGTHTCIGQSFARTTVKLFLNALIEKFASLEKAPQQSDWTFRGGYYTPDVLYVVGRAHGEPAGAATNGAAVQEQRQFSKEQLLF